MLVIDQHALHERILFEQLKERVKTGTLETQQLLIPEPVELTAEQAAKTLDHRQDLAELGLAVADFGGGTLLLTGYPALLGRVPPAEILKAVVDHLLAKERLPSREQLLNDLFEPDGLPRRRPLRRQPQPRGNRRPRRPTPSGRRRASLPAWTADGAALYAA